MSRHMSPTASSTPAPGAGACLLDIEAPLRELKALADVLQALGAGERDIDRSTIHVLGTLIEEAARKIGAATDAARDADILARCMAGRLGATEGGAR